MQSDPATAERTNADFECKIQYKILEKKIKGLSSLSRDDSTSYLIDVSNDNDMHRFTKKMVMLDGQVRQRYSFSEKPGLYIVSNALSRQQQIDICSKCLLYYAKAPNSTNCDDVGTNICILNNNDICYFSFPIFGKKIALGSITTKGMKIHARNSRVIGRLLN